MKTKEKEARNLRPAAPARLARPTHTTTSPGLEPASLDARLINFSQSAPLFLHLENGKVPQRDLDALQDHLQGCFPELLKLQAALRRTQNHRDELTNSIMRHMSGSYRQLVALANGEVGTENKRCNDAVDQSAHLMEDLQLADERYNEVAEKLQKLETSILEVTEAPTQRFVRWAIRESR